MKKKERFEVYIFDFDHDIYDQMIEIDCIQYIRKNHHFETKELLIDQIKKDIVQVRKLIAT
jgi:riboflavin kinase/FMN adenylyltransferase